MLLTGGTVDAEEGERLGLVDVPLGGFLTGADEAPSTPLEAVEAWASKHILRHSGAALRQGRKASRWPWTCAIHEELPRLEQQYLKELMGTADAVEGIQAFLDKRRPDWKNA